MKIQRRTRGGIEKKRAQQDLSTLSNSAIEGRVCGDHCAIQCPGCGSVACQCMCSTECPDISRRLSSDPGKHPIEPAVMPLVFEMKRLGIFQPCWSCEGHLGPDGKLWKLPQVWFYCDSIVHVRVQADALKALYIKKRIHTPWEVAIGHSDGDNLETAFAMRPQILSGGHAELASLQRDLLVIAEELAAAMTGEADRLAEAQSDSLDPVADR